MTLRTISKRKTTKNEDKISNGASNDVGSRSAQTKLTKEISNARRPRLRAPEKRRNADQRMDVQ
jgi:hypothetical protein